MIEKIEHTNIIIIGAGLVGLSVALSLKKQGLSVRVLENHLPEIATENSRPISLSFGSHRFLKMLGVWDLLATVASPILTVHVSELGKMGVTRFSAAEEKTEALGFVVPFTVLQNALYKKAGSITPITSIDHINCNEKGAEISVKSAKGTQCFSADLLIAADGANSTCRNLLNIQYDEIDHEDIAEIHQLTLQEDHDYTAYERFTKEGVFAVLPLFDKKKAQLVWTKKSGNSSEAYKAFALFQEIFEGRLLIDSAKKIAEFPLKTTIAKKQIVQSAVIMGNAAHTIYPLAAQGFNLGLHDVKILSDVITEAQKNKKNIGNVSVLQAYENRALPHQEKIIRITDQLSSWFELPLLGCARGTGLLALDLIAPLKNRLAKRMMGLSCKETR